MVGVGAEGAEVAVQACEVVVLRRLQSQLQVDRLAKQKRTSLSSGSQRCSSTLPTCSRWSSSVRPPTHSRMRPLHAREPSTSVNEEARREGPPHRRGLSRRDRRTASRRAQKPHRSWTCCCARISPRQGSLGGCKRRSRGRKSAPALCPVLVARLDRRAKHARAFRARLGLCAFPRQCVSDLSRPAKRGQEARERTLAAKVPKRTVRDARPLACVQVELVPRLAEPARRRGRGSGLRAGREGAAREAGGGRRV